MPRCAWIPCSTPVPSSVDPRKRFCSSRCRLRAHRLDVRAGKVAIPVRRPPEAEHGARVATLPIDRPAAFCYADPPYPGCAELYPEATEVDTGELVAELVEHYPDGWALSTGADALAEVLAACPAGVRIASWHRQARPYGERPRAWEPVIVCGGRRRPDLRTLDALVAHVPAGWDLPGRKPPAFFRWIAALLGADAGDTIAEPFPGSGTGAATFAELRIGGAGLGRWNVSGDLGNVPAAAGDLGNVPPARASETFRAAGATG